MRHSSCHPPIRCCILPVAVRIAVNGEDRPSFVGRICQPVALTRLPFLPWPSFQRRFWLLRQPLPLRRPSRLQRQAASVVPARLEPCSWLLCAPLRPPACRDVPWQDRYRIPTDTC